MEYEIIDQNDEYIVVNKPAGLLTHGAAHINEESLIEKIIIDFPEISQIGGDPDRPGIMQRLDKLASGLLVIARNEESFENLKSQFKNRKVKKSYIALAHGKIEKDYDTINFPIKRSTKGFKMAAIPLTTWGEPNSEGRNAITSFEVSKRYINYTLLNVSIKTGRTHQIRVHLAAYGHPLVGDDIYGTKKTRIKNKKLGLPRIFLVSKELSFKNLKGEECTYSISLPPELETFLKEIK